MASRLAFVYSALVATSLFGAVVQAAPQCFYPNGTVNPFSEPCNTSAQNSACCGPTDICLSSGYCLQQNQVYGNRIARGACTSKNWNDPACPQLCASDSTFPSISILPVEDTAAGSFCCSPSPYGSVAFNTTTKQCITGTQGSNQPFSLPFGHVIYDRSTGATFAGTLNASSLANFAATHTQTVTATPNAADGKDTIYKAGNTTAVAAGIAVPLSILLIGALTSTAILWSKLRKAQKQLRDQASNPSVFYSDPGSGIKQPLMETYRPDLQPPPKFEPTILQQPIPSYSYQSPVYEAAHTERNELPANQEPKEVPTSGNL